MIMQGELIEEGITKSKGYKNMNLNKLYCLSTYFPITKLYPRRLSIVSGNPTAVEFPIQYPMERCVSESRLHSKTNRRAVCTVFEVCVRFIY